jgi:hypothetical protein
LVGETDRLLDLYDAQLRAHVPDPLPAGVTVEREGPLVRTFGFGHHGWVEYRSRPRRADSTTFGEVLFYELFVGSPVLAAGVGAGRQNRGKPFFKDPDPSK